MKKDIGASPVSEGGPSTTGHSTGGGVRERALPDLIARLEKATGPDRELDILIATACLPEHHSGRWSVVTAPEFTLSINAALSLVPEGWWVVLRLMKNADALRGYYHCYLERDADIAGRDLREDEPEVISARNAKTAPIAICIDALKARHAGASR